MEDLFSTPPCYRSEAFAEDLLDDVSYGAYGASSPAAAPEHEREPASSEPAP